MVDHILRVASNQRLTEATHWAVFGLGALALTFSVLATAASAF
ncbi:MAG: hypothetical protein ORN49_06905 [Rhodobacteraceae bacterium]|nr:hypothetical protein [Paracoccaceae bacterium]